MCTRTITISLFFISFHEEVAAKVRSFIGVTSAADPATIGKAECDREEEPGGGSETDTAGEDELPVSGVKALHSQPVEEASAISVSQTSACANASSNESGDGNSQDEKPPAESISSSSSDDGFEKIESCDFPAENPTTNSPAEL